MSSYDSVSQSMPWLTSNKSLSSTRIRSMNVVNNIFIKRMDFVDDPYWKSILLDAAKGKFPKGFSFNDGTLLYRPLGKSMVMEDNINSINKFIDFIRINTGIRSKMDLEREKDYEREYQINHKVNMIEWSKISKFNKRLMVIEFVSNIKKIHNLDQNETDQLKTLINMNLEDDIIKKNVIMKDNNIEEIRGLRWDQSSRKFSLDGEIKRTIFYKTDPSDITYIEENIPVEMGYVETIKGWNKFLKDFNKLFKNNYSPRDEGMGTLSKNLDGIESSYTRSSNS